MTADRGLTSCHLLSMCRNTVEICDDFSGNIFTGGVMLNGEGTASDTQEILANKGE